MTIRDWAASTFLVGALTASVLFSPQVPVIPAAPGSAPSTGGARWNFDNDPAGTVPSGAQVISGVWAVRAESDAPSRPNALCQSGMATFPAILLTSKRYADARVVTRFKPISGRADQAAGIIFRVMDRDHYYILRANALEDNANFYRFERGTRSFIAGGAAKVLSGKWQELGVEFLGTRFRGFLNGRLVAEASDAAFKEGGVGLWTKADSVTCFDDVRVTLLH